MLEYVKDEVNYAGKKKAKLILLNIIRVLLVMAFFVALYDSRRLIMFTAALAFIITFLPYIMNKIFGREIPAQFEVLFIMFVYGVLFFWKIQGFYANFQLLSIMLSLAGSIALGLVGLTVMYTMYKSEMVNGSPLVIAFFSLCFAIAMGAIWEVSEFGVDWLFGTNLQRYASLGLMGDLVVHMIGAFVVSTTGYFYIKKGRMTLFSSLVESFIKRNSKFFGIDENHTEKIKELIKKGEHHKLEFKSTLRMNLHTNLVDRKIEHSAIKTVAAYMNSDGGTLLVGVSDKGEVVGLDADQFASEDAIGRHFTSLVKDHLGGEFLPLVKARIVNMDGKRVLKVDCMKSHKEVFVRAGNDEEFYVRNGALSTPLSGSSLVNYIENTFRGK